MDEDTTRLRGLVQERLRQAVELSESDEARDEWARISERLDGDSAVPDVADVIAHTLVTVPFYGRYLQRLRDGADIALPDLPLVRRDDLRTNFADLLSRDPTTSVLTGTSPMYVLNSSGSTGEPVSVLKVASEDSLWDNVLVERLYRELELPTPCVGLEFVHHNAVASANLVRVKVLPRPEVRVSLRSWNPADPVVRQEYRVVLGAITPDLVFASPRNLLGLTAAIEELGLAVRPTAVISTYENLSPMARARVSEVLSGRVADLYGSAETGLIGWSCAAGRIHTQPDCVYVETVPADTGRLLDVTVTSLISRAMPILRYQPGDLTSGPIMDGCECGGPGQVFVDLLGRGDQRMSTSDGQAFIQADTDPILKWLGVLEYQLIEEKPGQATLILPPEYADTADHIATTLAHGLAGNSVPARLTITPEATGRWHVTESGKRNCIVRRQTAAG